MGLHTLSNFTQLFTKLGVRNFRSVCELAFAGCAKFSHPLRNDIWDFRKPCEFFIGCAKCSVFLVFPMLENF